MYTYLLFNKIPRAYFGGNYSAETRSGKPGTCLMGGKAVMDDNASDTYLVTIDYGQELADMISEAGLESVSKRIEQAEFPHDMSRGVEKVKIRLIRYGREMESYEVEADLQAWGMRPATIQELIALAKVLPEPQWDFAVTGLGTRWPHRLGHHLIPRLTVGGGVQWQCLESARYEDGHSANCLFAAVIE